MSPQLSTQQLEHAISNLQKLVDAKKLEIHSYSQIATHAPAFWGTLSLLLPTEVGSEQQAQRDAMAESLGELREATVNLATAKINRGLVELEELELTLRAYKQKSSGIVGANLIPPSNSKMH